MALRLRVSEPIGTEIQRIAVEQLDDALRRLDSLGQADHEAFERTVHEVRKRCKEVRGMLLLLRPGRKSQHRRVDTRIRDAARCLSAARDAQVRANTLHRIRASVAGSTSAGTDEMDRLVREQRRQAVAAAHNVRTDHATIAQARKRLRAARKRVSSWNADADTDEVALALERSYRRGRRRHRRVGRKPSDESVHEWRKAVKQLWYQTRLLEATAPSALSPFIVQLDLLGEALGTHHDLSVLIGHLDSLSLDDRSVGVGRATALARAHQQELREVAIRSGFTVYAEQPKAFQRRLQRYWQVADRHGPERSYPDLDLASAGIAPGSAVETEPVVVAETHIEAALAAGANVESVHSKFRSETPVPSTMEHERKFLLVDDFDLGDLDGKPDEAIAGTRLMQGYLVASAGRGPRHLSVRLREDGTGRRRLTIKGGAGASRTEVELDLDRDSFDALWPYTVGRRIEKVRYRYPLGGLVAEIDVFDGPLDGLRLVEVEFSDPVVMAAFEPPAWFGAEVTDDPSYSNDSLAQVCPTDDQSV